MFSALVGRMVTPVVRAWFALVCGVVWSACSQPSSAAVQDAAAAKGGGVDAGVVTAAEAGGGKSALKQHAELERSTVVADPAPAISDADYHTFIQHLDQFGLRLGHELATSGAFVQRNLIYSPLSAGYALAMTYAGARGETAAEMKSVLGDAWGGNTFHSAANRLARELASRATNRTADNGSQHKLELNLADALFLERTLELKPAFLDLLARDYDSGVQRLDFRNEPEPARMVINDWVAEHTHDRILELLPSGSIDSGTSLVLVNALYFYGSWLLPFELKATRLADFHALSGDTRQLPTMHAYGLRALHAMTDEYSLAQLEYEGGHLSMTIVLPAEGKFESVRNAVSAAWLDRASALLEPQMLNLALPKFKLTVGTFSLKTGLRALGMEQAFTGQADFSGMVEGSVGGITDVLQKCFIEVEENGTEAAAATAVVIGHDNAADPAPPIPFFVDRPFLFFIRDENGTTLFSGHVMDPSLAN